MEKIVQQAIVFVLLLNNVTLYTGLALCVCVCVCVCAHMYGYGLAMGILMCEYVCLEIGMFTFPYIQANQRPTRNWWRLMQKERCRGAS